MDFVGAAKPLNENEINVEAQQLGCEPAAIWAVCDVESDSNGFLPDGRPKILFEAHVFHTLTDGLYDRSHPNISSPTWDRALYGASGSHQYDRLAEAILLNRPAALESASWGRFQILGSNFLACGYADIESYVNAMTEDEFNHLRAFGNFCTTSGIIGFLIDQDWIHFALRYNGSGNFAYYAQRLADAFKRHQNIKPTITPQRILKIGDVGTDVLELQRNLIFLGFSINADGKFGPQTQSAVCRFQSQYNVVSDGVVGPNTRMAIKTALAKYALAKVVE